MSRESFAPVLMPWNTFSARGAERYWREQEHHEEGSEQRNDRTAWRGHMFNRKLLQDGRCPPQGTGDEGQERTGSLYQHT
jgi:hypothetical protein